MIKNDKERFERASGVELTKEFTKSRLDRCVDIRDFFVAIMVERGHDFDLVASAIEKGRASMYASCSRFQIRCKSDAIYRNQYNNVKARFDANLSITDEDVRNEAAVARDFDSEIQQTIDELKEFSQINVDEEFLKSRQKHIKNERCIVLKILCDKHDIVEVSKKTNIDMPCLRQHLKEFERRIKLYIEFKNLYNEIKF